MFENTMFFSFIIFAITILFIIWRPRGINEAVPTAVGAMLIFLAGIVPVSDVFEIVEIISGASITILSTIVMSIVLESIGFFRWAATNIIKRANGSGKRLFFYVSLLCFLMTMFFNNDGSILITTPIIIQIVTMVKLKMHQKIPFLLTGALVATGASAPIGVSNLANLIALKIVGLDLNLYAAMMFIPSMIGIIAMVALLYFYFAKDIPQKIPLPLPAHNDDGILRPLNRQHPLADPVNAFQIDWSLFRTCMIIVVLIRASFFALAPFNIPVELPAIIGAVLLIVIRWNRTGVGPRDVFWKTPWHILIFAFSMYVVVYGLKNSGLTAQLVDVLRDPIQESPFNAIFIMGLLLTIMSNLCNNLPSVMIGTLTLLQMNLDPNTLKIGYLATIIGSDIGALITPMGTLASLIWMYILRKNGIKMTWGHYLRVSFMVIPITLIITLLSLFLWNKWLFF